MKTKPSLLLEPYAEGPISILIVDDEPNNLTVLETVLDDPGYRLVRAVTADEALLALLAHDFALLILDIRMPQMTGFQLAQIIKERRKTAQVPIIFLTAFYNQDEQVLVGYDSGAVDYLQKPVNPAILRSKVAVFAALHRSSRALLAEIIVRRYNEEQLRALASTLEERVTERTEALNLATAANAAMELEIVRREAMERALQTSQQTTTELLEKSRLLEIEQRFLSRLLLTAQEEERKRISRELHDVIAQSLTSVNYRLASLESQSVAFSAEFHQKIRDAQLSIEQAVDAVHRFARDLRPSMLDDLGLCPALETYLKDFQQRTQLKVDLIVDPGIETLDSASCTVLYRITQEALTNVVRHAAATHVTITIQQQPEGVRMEIMDNGKGFTPAPPGTLTPKSCRLGLLGMRERVEMAGGTFSINSAPGGPTTLRVELPATPVANQS